MAAEQTELGLWRYTSQEDTPARTHWNHNVDSIESNLKLLDGPIYALTGHTADLRSDREVTETFADLAAFEAAVHVESLPQACWLAGWPFPAALSRLVGRAAADGSFYWEDV